MEFIPTITKGNTQAFNFLTSTIQYENVNARIAQPPAAKAKLEVLIRFTIGVISAISRPYPKTNPRIPAIIKALILNWCALYESNKFPQIAPQIVCAAVGIQFIATQPPELICPIRIWST